MVDKVDITVAHLGSLFIALSSNSQQSSQQEVTNFQLCVNLRKCTNSTQYLPNEQNIEVTTGKNPTAAAAAAANTCSLERWWMVCLQ